MSDVINRIYEVVRNYMSSGGCPTPGCIGECAIIAPFTQTATGKTLYWSACYIWDDAFNDSAKLASWFHEGGAKSVSVTHLLYCDDNGDRDGRGECARAWHVMFTI